MKEATEKAIEDACNAVIQSFFCGDDEGLGQGCFFVIKDALLEIRDSMEKIKSSLEGIDYTLHEIELNVEMMRRDIESMAPDNTCDE
jgi:hypothetical protein